jgi:hypothetical protein
MVYLVCRIAAESSCRSPSWIPRSIGRGLHFTSRGEINSALGPCRSQRTRYRFFGGGGFGLGTPVVSAWLSVGQVVDFKHPSQLTVCAATHEHRAVAILCDHGCRGYKKVSEGS